MNYQNKLVGRQKEQEILGQALEAARNGTGGLLLIGGEAGMGKTRIVTETLNVPGALYLHYACHELRTPAFAPITSILRQYMDQTNIALEEIGPLVHYLNLILPELGPPPDDSGNQSTLLESIHKGFDTFSGVEPAVIIIDDLQWADNATLDVMLYLANHLSTLSILLVGVYRSDEIPRGHPLRWLRSQLRRNRAVIELKITPLTEAGTKELGETACGRPFSSSLAKTLYQRSNGVPLFIEQLVTALDSRERLQMGNNGLQLADDDEMPVPETIRDVVLLRLDSLSEASRQFAEGAAVIGERFDLIDAVALAGGEAGLDELMECHLIVEEFDGRAAFHHALTREVIYREIAWTRRRALHRQVAELLAREGAPPEIVAGHWLEARETDQARLALASAARHACQIHAYRDAAGFGNQALELWPDNQDEDARLAVVERFGNCAQLSGMLPEASRAWREAAIKHHQLGQLDKYAITQQRLAAVLELQGTWTQAITARANAAENFEQIGRLEEAAVEYLTMAKTLYLQGQYSQALELAKKSKRLAVEARKHGLVLRVSGLTGRLLARLGNLDEGLALAREALTDALDASDINAAVEGFLNLAGAVQEKSDWDSSRRLYEEAAVYCSTQGKTAEGQVCLSCLAFSLWHLGEWDEAWKLAQKVWASDKTPGPDKMACNGLLGRVNLYRGNFDIARPAIQSTLIFARQIKAFNLSLTNEWYMAMIEAHDNHPEAMMEHWRQAYEVWQAADDLLIGIDFFRWGATHFAIIGQPEQVRQSTSALNQIVAKTSNPEALAGLSHALGENLLLDGNPAQAVTQFEQAVSFLESLEVPYSKAQSLWRLGVALVETGDPDQAAERLNMAYTIFKRLEARPDYQTIENLLVGLGKSAELSPNTEVPHPIGLTRRQVEVLKMISNGMTNKEIAEKLVLSPRTVEMHVTNILNKLGCANRTEAVARAAELALI